MRNLRKPKKANEVARRLKWLEGALGILANAEQYNKARVNASYEQSKACYEFLCSRDDFRDWYLVEHTIKEL